MRALAMARATVIAGVSLVDSYRSTAEYLEAVGGDFAKCIKECIKKRKAGVGIGVSRQFETIITTLLHWGLHAGAISAIYTMGVS